MVIEIISRGIPPNERQRYVTCSICYSRLRYSPADAKLVADQREGDYYELTCPVCHRTITQSAAGIDMGYRLTLDR